MVEKLARCRINAIGAAAKIHLVEIEFQDLILRELPFQRHRQQCLFGLAAEGAVIVEEDGSRELLSDGGGALAPFA